MAKKPFISVDGITVGEANALVNVIAANGDITTGNIIVSNNANLGNVGNVTITGGTSGYVLRTDGLGNLSWVAINSSGVSNGNSNVSIPNANGNVNLTATGNTSLIVTGTGANIFGYVTATGNLTAANANLGNLVTANHFSGNGSQLTNVPSTLNIAESNITGGNVTNAISNVSTLKFDKTTGFSVTDLGSGNAVISLGSSFKTWEVTGQPSLVAVGEDTVQFIAGSGISIATSNISLPKSITFTANNVANATYANTAGSATTAGTVTVNAQPNITSIGTLTSLSISGNANTGNVGTTNLIATGTGSFGANVNMNNQYINNVGYPSANTDAASKQYVDTMVSSGIAYHQPVLVATTTTLAVATGGTTAYNSPNGAANGVGAYISTTGTFNLIDTANVQTVGTRILVKDEANATWNGVYTYANTTAIIRAIDADQYGPDSTEQLSINDFFFTTGGAVNEGVAFVVSAPAGTITFGTSNITFAVFSTSQVYDAGTGLTLANTTFSISNTTVTAGSYGNGDRIPTYTVNGQGQLTAASNTVITANAANLIGTTLNSAVVTSSLTTVGVLIGLTVGNGTANSTFGNGTINAAGNVTAGNVNAGNLLTVNNLSVTTYVTSNLIPNANVTYNLGSSTNRWKDLWLSNSTLFFDTNSTMSAGTVTNGNSNLSITTPNGNITFSAAGVANVLVVTSTGANITGTANISGNVNVGNLIGPVANGNSNVNIPAANGNINISAAGVANVFVITSTGANITGTANISGNANVGNIDATGGYFTTVAGSLTTNAQANITSVGTLTGLNVNATVTAVAFTANTGAFTGVGNGLSQLVGANVTGQVNFAATANAVAGANVSGAVAFATTANAVAGANVSGQVGNALIAGTVYTNAQPNITSVGTLSSLTVSGTTNLGAVGNITVTGGTNGYYLQTNGSGVLTWASIPTGTGIGNGNSNVNIPVANGNVNITAAGNANILVVTGTGANINGTLNVTGNTTVGNIVASGDGNITGANLVSANYFTGTLTTAAQPNITSVGTLTSLGVSGTVTAVAFTANTGIFTGNGNGLSQLVGANVTGQVTYAATANAVAGANVSGQVANALIAGAVYTNAQPNITSVGTLTSLSITGNVSSGNANLGNLVTANFFGGSGNNLSNIQASNITGQVANALIAGTVYTNAQPNITSTGTLTSLTVSGTSNLGAVGNVTITGGTSGYYLQTNGSGVLTWAAVPTGTGISNGNSNVNIPVANGNVTIGVSGTSNVVVVTSTGANITGTANITGNLVAGNITAGAGTGGNITGANLVSANYFTGTLTTAAQPNITSVGTLTSLDITGNVSSGNANLGNLVTANFFSGAGNNLSNIQAGNITGQLANALVAGTVYTAAQPNITSVGTLTSLAVSGNLSSGNANLGNLATANFFSGSGNTLSNIQGANVAGQVNFAATANAVAGANVSGQVGNALVAGTVYTNAQPNITSTGTLTSLTVSGTGSFGANVNMNNYWINNVGYPSLTTDVATKAYVDTMISSGIAYHAPVFVATTTTLAVATGGTTAYNSPNGAANGVGAYISTTGTYLNIDGANVQTVGTRILVKNEANQAWNGIYTYANTTAIVRASDADEYGPDSAEQFSINDYFFTTNGVVNEGHAFIVSAPSGTITFGTSNITFALFSTSQVYDAGTGITIDGTTISISNTTVTAGSYGNGDRIPTYTVNQQGQLTAASDTVITANAANLIGTTLNSSVVTSSLTSVGLLTGLTVGNASANTVFGNGIFTTTGNANIGNIGTTTAIIAVGNITTINTGLVQNGNSNLTITTDGNISHFVTGNATSQLTVTATGANIPGYANVVGNLTSGNANLGNLASANYFTGTLTTSAQPNITSVGTLTSLTVSGNANIGNIGTGGLIIATGNITGGNLMGPHANGNSNVNIPTINGNINFTAVGNTTLVITGTGANIAGTANISGNANVGNLGFGSGVIIGTGNITAGNANIVNSITVNNILITTFVTSNLIPNANVTYNLGNSTNRWKDLWLSNSTLYFDTNATVAAGTMTYGNSNFSIPTANGNITFSSAGNANIVVITGTGANITGTANITGNVFVANLHGPLANGNSNVNIPVANGNVNITAAGNANIVVVTGTGANITGTANISGNANIGNIGTSGLIIATGNITGGNLMGPLANGNSNVYIPSSNGNITFNSVGNANIVVITGTGANINGTANISGNANIGNIGTGGLIIATGNITGGNLMGPHANGNSNVNIPSANGNINLTAVGNTTLVITGTGANITGTANITGNLTAGNILGPLANGNSNVNIPSSNGNVNITSSGNTSLVVTNTGANVVGTFNVTGISNLNSVSNVIIMGGSNGYVLQTNGGGGLSWTPLNSAAVSNGNSNVSIPVANGNVNISAVGNANVLVITGTGANISGTLNATGNLIVANLITSNGSGGNISGANNISANTLSGNLTTTSQPNITSVGTLTSLIVSGTTNLNAVGNITITGGSNGQFLTTNGSGGLSWTSSIVSIISNGTSNLSIPTVNGNVNISAAGNANVLTVTGIGANVIGDVSATGNITGNYYVGNGSLLTGITTITANTVSANAQPNITSVGTLVNLTVAGNITSGNVYANTGTIGASLLTGTVTTNAQPNITSLGNLTGLNMSAAIVMGTNKITGLGTPTSDTDAATKGYVDSVAQGLSVKGSVIAATTTNITLSGTQTIDGVALSVGDRVLVKNQGLPATNGIYVCDSGVWARATDMDVWSEVPGAFTFVQSGTTQADTGWVCTSNAGGTINVTPITWTQFSTAGTYNAGTGLTLTGSTFSVNVAQPQITSVGTLTSLAVTGNITAGNISTGDANLTSLTVSNASGVVNFANTANVSLGAVANLHITGGNSGQVLTTDGTGNLSWANSTGGNGVPGGTNTQIQFNDGNTFGGNSGFTFDKTTGIFTAPYLSGDGNGLSNIQGANVSGAVSFATTANGVAIANVAGAGNVAITNYNGNNYQILAGGGSWIPVPQAQLGIEVDNYTGNGVATSYTLSSTPANVDCTLVSVAGTFQPRTSYSVAGNVINFSSAPPNTAPIEVTILSSQNGNATPSTTTIQEFSAAQSQTTFTMSGGYQIGSVLVFVNGIQMNNGDYTATNGTTVILTEPRNSGDIVRVISAIAAPSVFLNSAKAFSVAMSIALGM